MSFERLWGLLAFVLPAIAGLLAPMAMPDLAYQLRAGNEIIANRAIPSVDTWTATAAGLPWFDQQWGAQVVLAIVHALGGWAGLALLRALCIGATFAMVAAACRERGAGTRAATLLALAAFLLASPALALRPQLFGIVLFAAVLWLLASRRREPRRVWLVPVLVLVWANVHGSFVLAPVLVAWALAEDLLERDPAWRRTLALLPPVLAATLVTPWFPFGAWEYALAISGNAVIGSRVSEWLPPSPLDFTGLAFFASLVAAFGFVIAAWRGKVRLALPSIGLMVVLAVLALRAVRGLAWWPIGAVVALAPIVGRVRLAGREAPDADPLVVRETPRRARRLNGAVAGALGVVALVLLASWVPADPLTDTAGRFAYAPGGVTAAALEEAEPGEQLFHPQPWGSWLAFAAPDARPFVDSRIELYPDYVWADYDAILAGSPGWQAALDRWEIDLVLLAPGTTGAVGRFLEAGWAFRYEGPDGMLFVRPGRG